MEELLFDFNKSKKSDKKSKKEKKNKEKSLLEEFDEIDEYSPTITIGSYKPDNGKKNTVEQIEEANEMGDDWLRTISTFKQEPIKATRKKNPDSFFDFMGNGKKKKKKNKKSSGPKDYTSDFEQEMSLIKNILEDQTAFTRSLQRRYDILDNAKSSARGVGKYTTDLINSINQARDLSLKSVKEMSALKKTIADLNMKERKEMGSANEGSSEDMSNFSANFLRKMIQQDRADAMLYGDDSPVNGSADDIFENLSSELSDTDRSDDIEKYLKYENRNVKIVASVNKDDTSDYDLEAYADDGERLYDYPIPKVEKLDINRSTELASDEYHTKYPIKWR